MKLVVETTKNFFCRKIQMLHINRVLK